MNNICIQTRKILTNQESFWPVFTGSLDRIEARELSWQTKQFRTQVTATMVKEFLKETMPDIVRRNNPISGDPLEIAAQFLMWHLDDYFVNIELKQVQ